MRIKIPITAAIIIGAALIGLALVGVQWLKQNSIEKQQELEIMAEAVMEDAREERIDGCVDDAEANYWRYVETNAYRIDDDGTMWAYNDVWDTADRRKKDAIEFCIDRY